MTMRGRIRSIRYGEGGVICELTISQPTYPSPSEQMNSVEWEAVHTEVQSRARKYNGLHLGLIEFTYLEESE